MATKKKLLEAAAGAAGGAALNVEEVFSTYLYNGNGSTQTITNGIDLSGEGGLVWIKNRANGARHHGLFDTERGIYKAIYSNQSWVEDTNTGYLTAFNSDGFSIGSVADFNGSGEKHTSWTFRKAPKFFDVVTWTGTGGARTISHSLNTTVGTIIVKQTNASNNWFVYHRSLSTGSYPDAEDNFLMLNLTNAANDTTLWNSTAPTSTDFTVSNTLNTSSNTYVAYLFAHNDGDGDFGSTADQDIIKCGSYTGDGTNNGSNIVDVGFEPQWLLVKKSSGAANWILMDNMRGFVANATQSSSAGDTPLSPDETWNEAVNTYAWAAPTPNGFALENNFSSFNENGATYIYIAIRRGPMAVPESATDVFDATYGTNMSSTANDAFVSGFPVDFAIRKFPTGSNSIVHTRLTDKELQANTTNAESTDGFSWDSMTGLDYPSVTNFSSQFAWMWKRAPSFCDVIAYTGNSSTNTLNHNLGVAPEMIWYKARNGAVPWRVHANITSGGHDRLVLDSNSAKIDTDTYGTTKELVSQPTATQLVLGGGSGTNNSSSYNYVAYLFASLAGISKVGSYTGNGSTQTINCGFSSGARFVLIKGSSFTHDWHVFDTERGIVAGNDPFLELNTTNAENSSYDALDPYSAGFTINQTSVANLNANGASYIFYAIA